jgi:hypothetical protein
MSDAGLERSLERGVTPNEWYETLNSKVFFWLTEDRLERLLAARAYRDQSHDVLILDTASLLAVHGQNVVLSPINSGCTKPFPHPRGRSTFLDIASYPYVDRRRTRPAGNAVVELAVSDGIPDIEPLVVRVVRRRAGKRPRLIWRSTS